MSNLSRLSRLFTVKPKPSINVKPATALPNYDYSTPEGLQNVVDNFKKSCQNKQFRRLEFVYQSVVHRLAQAQAFSMIEDILEFQKQYKEISREGFVIRLISLYGRAGMVDHARSLFDQMPSFNAPRTVRSFSALLNAYIAAKRYDVVEDLFRQLSSQYSIQPNKFSYNIVIHALIKLGSTDSALSMFREMEELGLKPDIISFNTILGAFYEKHGYDEGEKIWAQLQARDELCPDVLSYRYRLSGMIMDGRISEAVKLVDEMILKGVKPDVHCFNVLIKGFCTDGNLEEAKYWYDELARNCTVDRNTYETLVPFVFEKGDFEMALTLCKKAISGTKLLIDVEVLKRVVEGFVAEGMVGEAKKLVHFAKKNKLELHLPTKLEVEPA